MTRGFTVKVLSAFGPSFRSPSRHATPPARNRGNALGWRSQLQEGEPYGAGHGSSKPDTIVMVHGLWMTGSELGALEGALRGARVHGPHPCMAGVRGRGRSVERRSVAHERSRRRRAVIESYEKFIVDLPTTPIIMGHSLGGAMTQVLLNRGLGCVGVGVSSATVKGVRDLPFSTLKAAGPALNPLKRGKPVPLTEKEFHYAFANTMTDGRVERVYKRYACRRRHGRARRHRAGQPAPEPANGCRLRKGRPHPAVVHRLQRGPRRAAEGDDAQRAEVRRLRLDHRVPGVRGPSAFPWSPGMGGGRRLRDRLGRASRGTDGGRSRCRRRPGRTALRARQREDGEPIPNVERGRGHVEHQPSIPGEPFPGSRGQRRSKRTSNRQPSVLEGPAEHGYEGVTIVWVEQWRSAADDREHAAVDRRWWFEREPGDATRERELPPREPSQGQERAAVG